MNTLSFILEKYDLRNVGRDYNPSNLPIQLPITRDDLARLFGELGFKYGVEIGVEQGKYSEVLARSIPGVKLHLVDAWKAFRGYRDHVSQEKLDGFYETAWARMRAASAAGFGEEVHFIRMFSMDAVKEFKPDSLDFVYIDAHHGFDYVMQDIIEWSKRVRPGGCISGHDFFRPKNNDTIQFGVIGAVTAYTSAHKISPWFITNEERAKSWFWVKS